MAITFNNKGYMIVGLAFVIGFSSFKAVEGFNGSQDSKLDQSEVMYGRDQAGNWHELDTPALQNLPCEEDDDVCKAVYETGYSPVTGTSSDPGFIRTEAEDGYIILP